MHQLYHLPISLLVGSLLSLGVAACGDDESGGGGSTSGGTPLPGDPANAQTFNHEYVALDEIPESCIDQIKSNVIFHYAHRSHGAQITTGAESLEAGNPLYGFETGYLEIPDTTNVIRVWDGMSDSDLVEADGYWATAAGLEDVRTILTNNPSIRYTSWAWSFEISSQTEDSINRYLTAMSNLEQEFPDVTFIYMTGTAQDEYQGANRTARNQQIRDYTQQNGRILYDFEDLDAWYNGDHNVKVIDGVEVPLEHPSWAASDENGYNYTHTTQESCENKARAFWVMLAGLEGCVQ